VGKNLFEVVENIKKKIDLENKYQYILRKSWEQNILILKRKQLTNGETLTGKGNVLVMLDIFTGRKSNLSF
jgi:hypothetical protein